MPVREKASDRPSFSPVRMDTTRMPNSRLPTVVPQKCSSRGSASISTVQDRISCTMRAPAPLSTVWRNTQKRTRLTASPAKVRSRLRAKYRRQGWGWTTSAAAVSRGADSCRR